MTKKFDNDKYYTPEDVAQYVVNKVVEAVGKDFTTVIEPSAGSGVFYAPLTEVFDNVRMYDLHPTDCLGLQNKIEEQDFLEFEYGGDRQSTLIIGNPPFGTRNTLSVRFYKKSITLADTIAFILPISQLNNNQQMFEYDLIHSEDLGKQEYVNEQGKKRRVHCCLNIYKIPSDGIYNKKPRYRFKEVQLKEYRRGRNSRIGEPSIAICSWGAVGKECSVKQYAQEIHVYTDNKDIIQFIKEFDWMTVASVTATPALYQWHVYEVLKKNFDLTEA